MESSGSRSGISPEEMMMRQQQMAENEEKRVSILDQILESAAKDRLSRLRLVRKEQCRAVEDALISAATNGKLQGKVSEIELIKLLEQFTGGAESSSSGGRGANRVIIQRKRNNFDDDDDDDDSDLM